MKTCSKYKGDRFFKEMVLAKDGPFFNVGAQNQRCPMIMQPMKGGRKPIMKTLLWMMGFTGLLYVGVLTAAPVTQVGRYSTVDNKPTAAQRNPLLAVATFRFSPEVQTIGEAMQQVLANTSYRLVSKGKQSQAMRLTLTKTLPITDRVLGPLAVKDTLVVLMGDGVFILINDPVHREINFIIKPALAKALHLKESTHV